MEVVQQAIGGRRDEAPAVDVIGQRAVGGVEPPHVVVEACEGVTRRAARIRVDGETRGERPRPFVEPDDAQQLVAERPLGWRRAA